MQIITKANVKKNKVNEIKYIINNNSRTKVVKGPSFVLNIVVDILKH